MNHYVTPAIASKVLGKSQATLRLWAKSGKIRFVRPPGSNYAYDLSSVGVTVDAWVPRPNMYDHDRWRALHAEGMSDRKIADDCGAHRTTVQRWRLRAGLPPGGQPAPAISELTQVKPPAAIVERIVSRPVEPPPAAKPMPQAPSQPRLDPAALRRAVEGLAMASRV